MTERTTNSREWVLQQDLERQGLLEARYYDTYRFANIIGNVLRDPFPYIRNLHDFYGDLNAHSFVEPFPRRSYFHRFIEFIIEDILFGDLGEFDLNKARDNKEKFAGIPSGGYCDFTSSPIERALKYHRIPHRSFPEWLSEQGASFSEAHSDDLYDYYNELRLTGELDELVEQMTDEVFFIMFLNRQAMCDFNLMMARVISDIAVNDLDPYQSKLMKVDGVLRRRNPPMWAKRAVFFRERGKCALTRKDLSGLLSTLNRAHIDHIVPLAEGGLNDITNLQLLDESVNLKKSAHKGETSLIYERWY